MSLVGLIVLVVLWNCFCLRKGATWEGIELGLVAQHPTSLPIAPTFIGRIASLIFIIVSEAFAEAIRQHPDYKGIKVGQVEHRVGTVADDTIFIGTTQGTLENIKTLLVKYERASAASINDGKSKLLDIDYSPQPSNPWVSSFDLQPVNSSLAADRR